MTIDNKHGHVIIRADEGKFITNSDMSLYGLEIILGKYDSPENYHELPIEQWPVVPEPEEPGDEPWVDPGDEPGGDEPSQEDNTQNLLELARASKLREIDAYDNSTYVNGFYLGGNLMWLDRETRASLKNTIESAILLGRDNLDIWFGDLFITLSITDARTMLAVLEMYATDCYNVTAQHKADVRAMDNIEDIEAFDVTKGYPEKPEFNSL
jgi:hypothetical protein